MNTTMTRPVVAEVLPHLLKKLAPLMRRAEKLDQQIKVTTGAPYAVEREEDGVKVAIQTVDVTLSGTTPMLAGWTFLAQIEHLPPTDEGERINLIRAIVESIPEQYRSAAATCEHCMMDRRRKYTYVVQNEQGEYRQIGSSCVQDFVGGHLDPAQVLAHFATMESIFDLFSGEGSRGWDEQDGFGMGRAKGVDILIFLAKAAALVRLGGYVSKKRGEEMMIMPTAMQSMIACFPKSAKERVDHLPEDEATAAAAVEWVKGMPEDGISDYMSNLRAMAHYGYVTERMSGYAASMIPTFKREMARRQAAALKGNSTFQGVAEDKEKGIKGSRLREIKVLVERVIGTYSVQWGDSSMHIMLDEQGNVYTWTSYGSKTLEEGRWYVIDGSVKAHKEYKPRMAPESEPAVKQTVLGRCATETIEEYDARQEFLRQQAQEKAAAKAAAKEARKAAPKAPRAPRKPKTETVGA